MINTYKNKPSQRGDVATVVLIVVVVVILGTLGYVFWKNQGALKDNTKSNTSMTESIPDTVVTFGKALGHEYQVSYPEGWTAKHEVTGPNPAKSAASDTDSLEYTDDSLTITSPSGDIEVWYATSNNASFGFTCGPGATLDTVDYIDVKGLSDVGLVELSFKDSSGQVSRNPAALYANKAEDPGLMEVKSAKKGDSYCDIQSRTAIPVKVKGGGAYNLFGRVHFVGEDAEMAADSYESDEYKTAKEILLTIKQN